MLEYEKIDISEGIDVNICHYWYFKDVAFKYEPYLCNEYHDLMQKAMGFNNIAIVYIKENAYRIHFWYVSKDDPINIRLVLTWLIKGVYYNFFLSLYI